MGDETVEVSQVELKLRGRAQDLYGAAQRAVILSDEDCKKGSDLAKMIRAAKTKLEDERKALVKPFNDGVKAINDRFKVFTKRLDEARAIIDAKVGAYLDKQAEERRAAAEEVRAEAATSFDEHDVFAPSERAPGPVRGSLSVASRTVRYDFEVVDITMVPAQYLAVDAVEVRRAINGKERLTDIPGIRIIETKSLMVR